MTCEESATLLHALIDGELDAENALAVEQHVAACPHCAAELAAFTELRQALAAAPRYRAPDALRRRIEAQLPARRPWPNRRAMLQGFAAGAVASGALAATLALVIFPGAPRNGVLPDILSAHLRSLQADHLTDVQSTSEHTVKPWFNGRIDVAPPVADLTAQGFTLIGGRLDYVDGKPVAALVYRRRTHVINVFVFQAAAAPRVAASAVVQGFNVRSWTEQGLTLIAISDLEAGELREFSDKFAADTGTTPKT